MTNELEKTFFDTFGIEPKDRFKGCTLGVKHYSETCKKETCRGCDCEIRETVYPQITDHILLELICILSGWKQYCLSYHVIDAVDINTLKSDILRDCICMLNWYEFNKSSKDIKQKVQTLFEDEN